MRVVNDEKNDVLAGIHGQRRCHLVSHILWVKMLSVVQNSMEKVAVSLVRTVE